MERGHGQFRHSESFCPPPTHACNQLDIHVIMSIMQKLVLCALVVLLAWKPLVGLPLVDLLQTISQPMKLFQCPHLFVVLLQSSKIFASFRELALLHTLTHIVMDKGTLRIPQTNKHLIVSPLHWSAALFFFGQEMLTGSNSHGRYRTTLI